METMVNDVKRFGRAVFGREFLEQLQVPAVAKRLKESGPIPGMLSFAERAMLQELVRQTWRGAGAIIDGGSFLGSSLASSAEGIRTSDSLAGVTMDSFPDGRAIHGYELGFLPAPGPGVDRRRVYGGQEYFLGDNFVPILEKTIAPYRDLISLHIGDLTQQAWDGSPIEVAFIDVCKTTRLNAHVSKEFFPALIPGASTLINQDFFFDRLPWIKVTMGYLSGYFQWEGQVMSSSIYRTIKSVPADVAAVDPFLEGTLEECLELHDAVDFSFLEPMYAYRMGVSRAYLIALKGSKDGALDVLRELETEYAELLNDGEVARGNRFRHDRAVRQITNGHIFKVA